MTAYPTTRPHRGHIEKHLAIPGALVFDTRVSHAAVRVYAVLQNHGHMDPTHADIARCLGVSKRSVPTWVRELEAAGWLDRSPRWFSVGRLGEHIDHAEPGPGREPAATAYLLRSVPR